MTYRDLLNELSKMPDAALDQTVTVNDADADETVDVERLTDWKGVEDDDAGQLSLVIREVMD